MGARAGNSAARQCFDRKRRTAFLRIIACFLCTLFSLGLDKPPDTEMRRFCFSHARWNPVARRCLNGKRKPTFQRIIACYPCTLFFCALISRPTQKCAGFAFRSHAGIQSHSGTPMISASPHFSYYRLLSLHIIFFGFDKLSNTEMRRFCFSLACRNPVAQRHFNDKRKPALQRIIACFPCALFFGL